MPALSPCKRRDFIRKLKALGYDGPFAAGRHQHMVRKPDAPTRYAPVISVPHTDIDDLNLLARILRASGITRDEFMSA